MLDWIRLKAAFGGKNFGDLESTLNVIFDNFDTMKSRPLMDADLQAMRNQEKTNEIASLRARLGRLENG